MAGQELVLQFYRWEAGIQILGQSAWPVEVLTDERRPIFKHFLPNEEKIQAKFRALQLDSNTMAHLIGFTASCATLNLREPLHQAHHISTPMTKEYQVVHPQYLMLIAHPRINAQVVERINVTVQSRLARADDWVSLRPRKSIFFMA
ncbi:hypothetical protein INS49_013497 [Diaporthe citri]|uniref:uncharacterized protein n=1 Tax=Diaporthe citri TaxID=83186 RepID=UPI001C7FCEC7|nr:uncharacterized protein INS49_013497 [Diaporthe citri]KAG6357620.1 hypothetical protein INS49_013497 [Diaporthe citri]